MFDNNTRRSADGIALVMSKSIEVLILQPAGGATVTVTVCGCPRGKSGPVGLRANADTVWVPAQLQYFGPTFSGTVVQGGAVPVANSVPSMTTAVTQYVLSGPDTPPAVY